MGIAGVSGAIAFGVIGGGEAVPAGALVGAVLGGAIFHWVLQFIYLRWAGEAVTAAAGEEVRGLLEAFANRPLRHLDVGANSNPKRGKLVGSAIA